jgi:hypothetical protein
MSIGFGIFDPLGALEDAAGEVWDAVEGTVVKWVPGGLAIAATVEAGKANVAAEEKANPTASPLDNFEAGLSKTWDQAGDAASVAADETLAPIEAKLKKGLTALDWLTEPWVLAGIGLVVAAAVLGPYVLPFFPRRG